LESLAHNDHSNVKSNAKLVVRAFLVVHLETVDLKVILHFLLVISFMQVIQR